MSLSQDTERLVHKIKRCPDFGVLFTLVEDFNSIGLALRETQDRRMVLCRVAAGRPVAAEMIDDYIFVGYADQQRIAIPREIEECVVEFITAHASDNKLVSAGPRRLAGHTGLYGGFVRIENEGVMDTLQGAALGEAKWTTELSILDAIKRWLEDSDAQL